MKDFLFTDLISFVGEAPKKFTGYKKYVSTGAVNGNIIESDDIELVEYSSRPSRANLVASSGDILFAKMAETEKTLLLDDETEKNIYSTGFCAIRAKENIIESKALYYLLGSSLFLNQKNTNSSGATQRAITNTGLSKIRIKLPTMEKQREFCGIMDKVVDSIELRKKQLGYFDKFTKSLFIEMFGDPIKNEKDWRINKFRDICTVRQGLQIPISKRLLYKEDNCYEYITVAYLHGSKEREYIKNPKETVICNKEDILMTRTGNTGMVITGVHGVFHNNFFLIDFDRYKFDKCFLVEYLNLELIQLDIMRRAGSSTIPDLNHDEFYKINVYVPPLDLQKRFAEYVSSIDKSKLAVKKSLEELEVLKKSLMQKYFA